MLRHITLKGGALNKNLRFFLRRKAFLGKVKLRT